MKPWEALETIAADGITLKLARHDRKFLLLADGLPLMSSRMHGSEDDLATIGCRRDQLLPAPCSSAAWAWASRCAPRSTSCPPPRPSSFPN